jgi:hypothetical protein
MWLRAAALLSGLAGVVLLVGLGPPALYDHIASDRHRAAAEAWTRAGFVIAALLVLVALGIRVDRAHRRWWLRAAAVMGALVGLTGIVLLVWLAPPALYRYVDNEKDRASAEAATRTGMIAGLVGIAALAGLVFTARTYRLTQEGHITDRYTKAIEQLGSDKLDVRLGGIYALDPQQACRSLGSA